MPVTPAKAGAHEAVSGVESGPRIAVRGKLRRNDGMGGSLGPGQSRAPPVTSDPFPETEMLDLIIPDWPAPARVRGCTTTRRGGVSEGPYADFNLAAHVGDDAGHVGANRAALRSRLGLTAEPAWLTQVHGTRVVEIGQPKPGPVADGRGAVPIGAAPEADGSVAFHPGVACTVLTADCLPVIFCTLDGSRVAAAHAGWRGLAAGVLEATAAAIGRPAAQVMAWLGPGIGATAYEVGPEVRDAFVRLDPATEAAFVPGHPGRWQADMYELARLRLAAAGVTAVYGGSLCTYSDADRFFSYRRDRTTGRMATLAWIDGTPAS